MKIGSKVKVRDGSWSLRIDNKKFNHSFGIELSGREFELLNIDMKLPSSKEGIFNDSIIKDLNNDEIVFIQKRFLEEIIETKEVKPVNIVINLTVDKFTNVDDIFNTLQKELKKIGIA